MYIPKLDQRKKKDIINEMKRISENYTPEWNFDVDNPDMGAAAAMAGARLFSDTIDKYNQTAENNYIEFFRRLGAEPLYEAPAKGYACFEISNNMDSTDGETLDHGDMLYGDSEDGTRVPYMIDAPIFVANNRINSIIYNDTVNDEIYELYNNAREESIENIKIIDNSLENLQSHEMYICCQCFDGLRGSEKCMLSADLDRAGNRQVREFMRHLKECNPSYYSDGRFVPCRNCHVDEGSDTLIFYFDPDNLPAKKTINNIEGYWLYVRLAPISFFENIYIKEIRIGTMAQKAVPDAVLDDDGELDKNRFRPFGTNPVPYSSVYFVCDSVLYNKTSRVSLSFRVDYERTSIYEMDIPEDTEWKFIMKKNKFKKPKEYDVTIAAVVWEYFNGFGWVRLFDKDAFYDVFSGKNGGHSVKIEFDCPKDLVKVFLPTGEGCCIRARIVTVDNYMKQNGYYVTPLLADVQFSYRYEKLPKADSLVAINNLESRIYDFDNLKESIRCARRERENTDSIYFLFDKAFDHSGTHIFFSIQADNRNKPMECEWEYYGEEGWCQLPCVDKTQGLTQSGLLSLKKSIKTRKVSFFNKEGCILRLRFLPDNGLRRCLEGKLLKKVCLNTTDIINIEQKAPEYFVVTNNYSLECQLSSTNIYKAEVFVDELPATSAIEAAKMIDRGNAEPVYAEDGSLKQLWVKWNEIKPSDLDISGNIIDKRTYVLDRDKAAVSFENSILKPPVNGGNENVFIRYSVCSGKKGNMGAGERLYLEESRSFITGAYCPEELSGGFDKDDTVRTLERGADRLRMGSRVCTADDFEDMSSLLYRGIIKVKCLENRNIYGKSEPGAVTLVILLKNMNEFEAAGKYLKEELLRRCSAGMRASAFNIVRPKVLLVDISVEIKVETGINVYEARAEVHDRLVDYFGYETENEGCPNWEIGDVPQSSNVRNFISSLEAVAEVKNFYMACFLEGDGGVDELTDKELLDLKNGRMTIARLRKLEIFSI